MRMLSPKRAGIGAALVAVAATIAGCGSGTAVAGSGSGSGTSSGSSSVLTQIKSSRKITIGILPGDPSYDTIGTNGKPSGFEIDLANNLASTLGAKATLVQVTPAGRVAALQAGKVQVVLGDFTMTPQRAETIWFSDPYLLPRGQFVVKAGSPIRSMAQLNTPSTKICVGQGSTDLQNVPLALPKAKLVALQTLTDCEQALLTGQVTALSQDELNVYAMQRAAHGKFKTVSGYYATDLVGVGLPYGDVDMRQFVNNWIANLVGSGEMKSYFNKWWPGFQGISPLPAVGQSN